MKKTTQHTVLQTEDLTIGYLQKKKMKIIASDINLQLYSGEFIGLVGGNGIGKSTLLRTLSNIQPALYGTIYLAQKQLFKYPPITLATKLSLVLTEDIPSKNITVQELVALGRQPYTNWVGKLSEEDIVQVKKAIKLTQIEELIYRKCHELSDGQLQKVLIARAIAQDTPLIILDEPTTHLDIYHKAYIFKLLQRLAHQTQKTILFSTHEIDFAIQLCDKLIVMHPDSYEYGRPKELIQCNSFEGLFPKDLITFDASSGRFKIK